MTTLRIPTAPVFKPLLKPARYLGAWGGRGSGKSNFFGELMVEQCLMVPGTLAVCIREVQKSLMQSSKRMIETKIQSLGVGSRFQILHDRIITCRMRRPSQSNRSKAFALPGSRRRKL